MAIYSFRKRAFLNPVSTDSTSYIFVHVESSHNGDHAWGSNMVLIGDCHRRIELEFSLGTKKTRRVALAKIDLLIKILTRFRDALAKEIALIEKVK